MSRLRDLGRGLTVDWEVAGLKFGPSDNQTWKRKLGEHEHFQ
jgi:hypothetical protein